MDERSRSRAARLTDGWLLAKNVCFNAGGVVATTATVLIAIPFLIHGLGIERFGLLTLVWTLIAYFKCCDFGLGSALTKFVSDRLGRRFTRDASLASLIRTALLMTLAFGLLGALLWVVACPSLVYRVFRIPVGLRSETLRAFYVLALALPAMACQQGMRGALSAYQRFDLINAIRVPVDVASTLGLLIALPFSHSLTVMVAVLVFGRVVQCLLLALACVQVAPGVFSVLKWKRRDARVLLGFGKWVVISGLSGPLLNNIETFIIAALLPAEMLALYATPCELASRIWYLPLLIEDVWFAALAISFTQQDERMAVLTGRVTRLLFLMMFPLVLVMILYAHGILGLWLGPTFAQQGALVMQLAALAVLVGALRTVPSTLLRVANRPDIPSKFRLIELPLYGVGSWLLVRALGINGAAAARLAREVCEALVLLPITQRILPRAAVANRVVWLLGGAAVIGLALTLVPPNLTIKIPLSVVILGALVVFGWSWLLEPGDRRFIKERLDLATSGRLGLSESGR